MTARRVENTSLSRARADPTTVQATSLARQAAKIAQEALVEGRGGKRSMIEEMERRFYECDPDGNPVMSDKDRLGVLKMFAELSESRALVANSLGLNRFALSAPKETKATQTTNVFFGAASAQDAMSRFLEHVDPSRKRVAPAEPLRVEADVSPAPEGPA